MQGADRMGCEAMEDLKVQGTKENGRSGRLWLQMIFVRQVLDHPARIDQSADPTIIMRARKERAQATVMVRECSKVKPAKVRTNCTSMLIITRNEKVR